MMKKTFVLSYVWVLVIVFSGNAHALNTGPWRFELKTNYGAVPFIIHIQKKKSAYSGTLHNGQESIKLTGIQESKQGLKIPLQTYEISLEMDPPHNGRMNGYLVRHNKNPVVKLPVSAFHGQTERFPGEKSPAQINLAGRWSVSLLDDQDKKETGVVVFEQQGNKVSGSILTPTGDYRYLEGFVSGQEFEMASFDGVYNYLFKGKVVDGKLVANILSNYKTMVEGTRNEKADLPDAYKMTQVESVKFTFPDLNGKKVSLDDRVFANKPVIIQFFGSWCPNCLDETNYLIPWYEKNKSRGIEIIGLAFERSLSPEDAKKQLMKTKKKMGINYTLLMAGATSEDRPSQKIPGLKNFISFPTTVFINKKHEVVKVHAGFTGPSTGEFYQRWQQEFNKTVNELLK
jgi:thiol-disulfide isomerase/thioredoxin